jgi:hypothetical protein
VRITKPSRAPTSRRPNHVRARIWGLLMEGWPTHEYAGQPAAARYVI